MGKTHKIKGKNIPKKPVVIIKKKPKKMEKWFSLILFAFAFLLYTNTLNHGYVLDDFGALKDNWVVKSGLEGIPTILKTTYRFGVGHLTDGLYRPLPLVMYAIEWHVSPENPNLYHFINILFYALAIVLLFYFLKRLMHSYSILFPFFITLLFAAHPIHTEVVANIKSRDEIMSFFFLMISFLTFIRFIEKEKWIYLGISLTAYFLSFLSKEGVITMLPIYFLIAWYISKKPLKNQIIPASLMLIPAFLYIYIRHRIISIHGIEAPTSVVDNFLAVSPNFATQFATAVSLLGKYVLILFIPYPLISDYGYQHLNFVTLHDFSFIISIIVYIGLAYIVIKNFNKKSFLVFGILFFLFSISLYSNIIFTIGAAFAERFLFLPSLGFCIAFVIFLAQISSKKTILKDSEQKTFPPFAKYTMILIIFIFSILTVNRAAEWKDQYTLFGTDVKKAPKSAHLRLWWGLAIRDKALEIEDPNQRNIMMKQAVEQFDAGLIIHPQYPDCYEQLGLAWYRLGAKEKAHSNYEQAILLNPYKAVTHSNLGILYFEKGNYQKAFELYQKSVKIDPRYADGWFNLGSTYGAMGRYEEAIEAFKTCIIYESQNLKAHEFLALTYENMNQMENANIWKQKTQILQNKLKK